MVNEAVRSARLPALGEVFLTTHLEFLLIAGVQAGSAEPLSTILRRQCWLDGRLQTAFQDAVGGLAGAQEELIERRLEVLPRASVNKVDEFILPVEVLFTSWTATVVQRAYIPLIRLRILLLGAEGQF